MKVENTFIPEQSTKKFTHYKEVNKSVRKEVIENEGDGRKETQAYFMEGVMVQAIQQDEQLCTQLPYHDVDRKRNEKVESQNQ